MTEISDRVAKLTPKKRELLALRMSRRNGATSANGNNGGGKQLVAYVVPNPDFESVGNDHQSNGDAAVKQLKEEQVAQWREVYDEIYGQANRQSDPTFNITGWDSSYTGLPIPAEQMREQVDRTVERILRLRPRRVLEIGCGTGLLLFRVAPHCEHFCGTDFSPQALNYVREQLEHRPLPQVSLLQKNADDFQGIDAASFDAVVLNSVVQYFPSVEYLVNVLVGAASIVADGGHIFLGDVRSFPLWNACNTAVELFKANASLNVSELQSRARRRGMKEEELLVDPDFFAALARHVPRIRRVEVQLKRGKHLNELTRFRYDVTLQIGGEPDDAATTWLDWSEVGDVESLRQRLDAQPSESLGVRDVPNSRLRDETRALELLESSDCPDSVGALRKAIKNAESAAIDPESFWALAADNAFDVHVGWAASGALDRCDVLLRRRRDELPPVAEFGRGRTAGQKPWRAYANNPLMAKFSQRIVPAIRGFLLERLPEYMVPSVCVPLDALPLSSNGKVDRRALPEPTDGPAGSDKVFAAPKTEIERKIAAVWQDLLGLERVGLDDNFFDLGGHSLLMVRLRSRLRDVLGVEPSIIDLFQFPTVSAQAKRFGSPRGNGAPRPQTDVHRRAEKQRDAIQRMRQRGKPNQQ